MPATAHARTPSPARHRRQQGGAHQAEAGQHKALSRADQAAGAEPGDGAGLHPGARRPGEGRRGKSERAQRRRGVADSRDGVRYVRVPGEEAAGEQAAAEDRGRQPGPGGQGPWWRQPAQRGREQAAARDRAGHGRGGLAGTHRGQGQAGTGDHAEHGQERHRRVAGLSSGRYAPQGQHHQRAREGHQRQEPQEHPPPAAAAATRAAMAGPISPGTTQAVDITANMRGRQRSGYPREIATYATAGTTPAPRPCTARPRHQHRHAGGGAADDQAGGEERQAGEHRPAQRHPVGPGPGQHDADEAGQHERAEHPAVQPRSPRWRLTTGSTVAMASASKATRVTASTRPVVSDRRSGAHTPPGESASVRGVVSPFCTHFSQPDTKLPPPGARQRTLARDVGEGSCEALYGGAAGRAGCAGDRAAAAP